MAAPMGRDIWRVMQHDLPSREAPGPQPPGPLPMQQGLVPRPPPGLRNQGFAGEWARPETRGAQKQGG